MTEQEMIRLAEELGFASAAVIDTEDIVFIPAFRPLCEENLCGKYGVNYACPPACGTVEEVAARVRSYRRALVLQTMWDIDDPMDVAQTKPAKTAHNRMALELKDRIGGDGLVAGAGGCDLCRECALVHGEPCRFPDRKFSCMSAYCVFVQDLAQRCGMEYDCGPGVVGFFGMYCFDKREEQEDGR